MTLTLGCHKSSCTHLFDYGPVYKTNLVRTKSLSDHCPDQIWLCKRYLSVPKIWSGPKSGPKRDLLMCKDHGPIKFGPVPNIGYVNAPCSSDQTKSLTFGGKSQSSNENGESATWCKLAWIIMRILSLY